MLFPYGLLQVDVAPPSEFMSEIVQVSLKNLSFTQGISKLTLGENVFTLLPIDFLFS